MTLSSPPAKPVLWTITLPSGVTMTGTGQTAYAAWRDAHVQEPFGMCRFSVVVSV